MCDVNVSPIGYDLNYRFTGVFDGNGHVIRGLTIDAPKKSYVGLFGCIGSDGEVKNLGIEDVNIRGAEYVGGLCGHNSYGTMRDCYSTGSISGENRVGGLCGRHFDGVISDCYSTASVAGTGGYVGGVCGFNQGPISNCYSTGNVSGNSYVGGLCGHNSGMVRNSLWDTEASGISNSEGGIGFSTVMMQTMNTYSLNGWAGETWTIDDGNDYPHLAWENAGGEYISEPVVYMEGSGTEAEPYRIACVNDLLELELWSYLRDKYLCLEADLDMGDLNLIRIGYDAANPFTGVFDGNGHVIRNLTMDVPDCDYLGLFGYVGADGEIKNVVLEDVNVTGHLNVGGLCGFSEGTISNCFLTGSYVTGTEGYVGGIVGVNMGVVVNSHVVGTIEGYQLCGGIAGFCWGVSRIDNCSFSGTVRGTLEIGGIVGETRIEGMDKPEIVRCHAIAEVIGARKCGGIVGYNVAGDLRLCFSSGIVTCSAYSAGGFAGTISEYCGTGGNINDCHADVTVNCSGYAGGFCGSALGSNWEIRNCYSTGEVVYDVNNYENVGGFMGDDGLAPEGVFSSYFLETAGPSNGLGESLSEEEMKQQASFAAWDFVGETISGPNDIWTIKEGVDYPQLVWSLVNLVGWYEVDGLDFAYFASRWGDEDCGDSNDCDGVDFDFSGEVDWGDFKIFCDHWLEGIGL